MKELLYYIVKALVDNPDEVSVTEKTREDGELVLELTVAQSDMGKVIGRQGRIVKAIRSIMKSAAAHENIRVSVDILG
ncbi:MAG: KH domain-containing protein [Ruminococcaceae bacterium]|nr:KH domain-containing protein [Oscillospiraceae bacterium]MBQ8897452.1 KH domain-containing protein [Clostridia bacterium]